jgi:hypothetical protein
VQPQFNGTPLITFGDQQNHPFPAQQHTMAQGQVPAPHHQPQHPQERVSAPVSAPEAPAPPVAPQAPQTGTQGDTGATQYASPVQAAMPWPVFPNGQPLPALSNGRPDYQALQYMATVFMESERQWFGK